MSTAGSRSEFAEFFRDLRLPDSLRDALRETPGPVLSGDAIREAVKGAAVLVSVGDYCTKDLLQRRILPDIAIVDFKTRREERLTYADVLENFGEVVREVENPPAMITKEAWLVISEAFKSKKRVRIDIRGEEDLLALVCIAIAPPGAVVLYGLPGKGAVVVRVDAHVKGLVRDILRKMVS